MTEAEITALLAQKHGSDIFIPQCKTGPSYGAKVLILDAWVVPHSWVKPIICYEIKVSRSDFLRDAKWRDYLPYCHQFSFVVPYQMVTREEVPAEAGLSWVSKNGKAIRCVKRAPIRRDAEIPYWIFQYAMMWRMGLRPDSRRKADEVMAQPLLLEAEG